MNGLCLPAKNFMPFDFRKKDKNCLNVFECDPFKEHLKGIFEMTGLCLKVFESFKIIFPDFGNALFVRSFQRRQVHPAKKLHQLPNGIKQVQALNYIQY